MITSTRRKFLLNAAASGSLLAVSQTKALAAATTGQRPTIAFIGCGGRSKGLQQGFGEHVEVAWCCDPDAERCRAFQARSGAKRTTADLREVLDDPLVEAVVIATPDHWHAPAAILACEAKKHVYVEKPCSHNLREGRLLVAAARRNRVVVQHGTQSRSNRLIAGAMQMLREGIIGEVLVAKAWNVQRRRDIGKAAPAPVPEHVDYETWLGPAEYVPFQANRFHYDWHWWWNFGTGDIGNDGTHEIDIARWGLGVDGLPATVTGIGGKYYFDDDQQFPDCATCGFEWPGDGTIGQRKQLLFEMRLWSTNYPYQCDTGVEFLGTKGRLFVSKRGKLEVFGERNQRIPDAAPKKTPVLPENHQVDFLNALATGGMPTADIAVGHDSVALVHLANIAVRLGRSLRIEPQRELILNDEEANRLLGRTYRSGGHWAVPT